MRRSRPLAAAVTGSVALALAAAAVGGTPAAATAAYSVQTLHFAVATGADGSTPCDIIGDLYLPADASPTHKVPAILTTNGFGGSKDDQAGIGAYFAGTQDYAVLSYSGLGFGGSGCKITLDDRDHDGRAASQLVSYLGGASGIAFTDAAHTTPAPALTVVQRDAKGSDGRPHANDPRVGMIGGSYGGQIQFAAAAVDPRIDTIVPQITWNDLAYSLDPNNTAQTKGVTTSTPGAVKLNWAAGFSAEGAVQGVQQGQADPSRLVGCPNFADFVCPALVTGGTTGYLQPDAIAALQTASVSTYYSAVKIPVLLMQGETDTLFNLTEAIATYKALKAQGTPVQMIWQQWGHSGGPAAGEYDASAPDPATQYDTQRIVNWFNHYLRGSSVSTGPAFAYFRDWVSYTGRADAAYASSSSFPVGTAKNFYLGGSNGLVGLASDATAGSQSFVTPPAGLPTSLDPQDVFGSYTGSATTNDPDAPGTAATWTTTALSAPVDVAGSPTLRLQVSAPTAALTQLTGPAGQLVLFVKLQDVAPDGTVSLIRGQVAPIRVPDVTAPFTVTLPAIVHQFAAGHQLRLDIAGGSLNYRGGVTPTPVTIASGPTQVLTLPTVAG
ncbi:MAG: CocE/NonD family hydrolase [Jatrophihabitans sp.]|uniref:CocE/NonD family hydrolase n=1 Tax=Jatrophihabitans sp. TaxID=1932789 RepID=UPI003F7FD4F0